METEQPENLKDKKKKKSKSKKSLKKATAEQQDPDPKTSSSSSLHIVQDDPKTDDNAGEPNHNGLQTHFPVCPVKQALSSMEAKLGESSSHERAPSLGQVCSCPELRIPNRSLSNVASVVTYMYRDLYGEGLLMVDHEESLLARQYLGVRTSYESFPLNNI